MELHESHRLFEEEKTIIVKSNNRIIVGRKNGRLMRTTAGGRDRNDPSLGHWVTSQQTRKKTVNNQRKTERILEKNLVKPRG